MLSLQNNSLTTYAGRPQTHHPNLYQQPLCVQLMPYIPSNTNSNTNSKTIISCHSHCLKRISQASILLCCSDSYQRVACRLVQRVMSVCASLQDILALGAIFATTDSVAVLQVLDKDRSPILFSLVFGEGVINDAAGVALLRAIQV